MMGKRASNYPDRQAVQRRVEDALARTRPRPGGDPLRRRARRWLAAAK